MIDWITAILPVPERINGGMVVHLSCDGEIESSKVKFIPVQGSYDSKTIVSNVLKRRSDRGNPVLPDDHRETCVMISGNPSKWFQGHNIYGVNNLRSLASRFFAAIARNLGYNQDIQDRWHHVGLTGRYELTRIDITESYRVGKSNTDVSSWIFDAHKNARVAHKQSSLAGGNTLYFGKNSRRHTIKVYNKYLELQKHKLDYKLDEFKDQILADVKNILRVEVTYRAQKLREMGFQTAQGLDMATITTLYNDSVKCINLNTQVPCDNDLKGIVSRSVYGYYLEWKAGTDLKRCTTKATFYRVRSHLLPFGIDISLPVDVRPTGNVLKFQRVLEATPAGIPAFYYDNLLIAV